MKISYKPRLSGLCSIYGAKHRMIRVYIGLEDPEDMINDLDQAMTKMRDV